MNTSLAKSGQIKAGDIIHCEFKGKQQKHIVVEVLDAGTDREEILLDKKSNLYFITIMAINGSSWAKNVTVEDKQ